MISPSGKYTTGGGVTLIVVPDAFRSAKCTEADSTHNATGCEETVNCPRGTYGSTPPTGACSKCPSGFYSSGGNTECQACKSGMYQNVAAQDKCENCPTGQYQPERNQTKCTMTIPGTYSDKQGAKKPVKCPEGQYQEEKGQDSCIDCPSGWSTTEYDQCGHEKKETRKYLTSCIQCELGQSTNNQKGEKVCQYIPPNLNVPPPMLKTLRSPNGSGWKSTSWVNLYYHVHFDTLLENEWEVVEVEVQWSTQPNLADQKEAKRHPDWNFAIKRFINFKKLTDDAFGFFTEEDYDMMLSVYNSGAVTIDQLDSIVPGGYKDPEYVDSDTNLLDVGFAQRMTIDVHSCPVGEVGEQLLDPCKTSNYTGQATECSKSTGPVWRKPVYVRAAYRLKNGGTSAWSIENKKIPITSECSEKEGVQHYLRTHPHDDTCESPIDMLGYNQSGLESGIECIPCPEGGSCNSPMLCDEVTKKCKKNVGVLLWDIAPLQGYWRIPWAPTRGDLKNDQGELIKAPQWFYKCPHEEACLGVTPRDEFGVDGWVSTASEVALADQTLDTYIALKTVEHINNGRNWSCQHPFPRSRCLRGTEGPLCEVCIQSFTRINGKCVECYEVETRMALLVGVLVLLLVVIVWVRQYFRTLQSNTLNAVRDVSRIMIIMINMAQVITSIPNMILVTWPKNVVQFLEQFDFVNIDLASITGATCENSVNFHARFLVMSLCPPVIIVLALLIYFRERCKLHRRRELLETAQSADTEVNLMFAKENLKNKRKLQVELQESYTDLFQCIDIDESGSINAAELVVLLQMLGYDDPRIDEALALELLHKIGGSSWYDSISKLSFVLEMQTGSLSRRLHRLLYIKDKDEVHHSKFILKWNRRRKLISFSFSWAVRLLMLLHTPISRKVFQFFDCVKIGPLSHSKSFLRADYSIQCQDGLKNVDSYNNFMVYIIITFSCYTILLPVVNALILFLKRNTLYTPTTFQNMGWMYERLSKGSEWWDVHEILRKMILCGVLVFFPADPGMRASMALCVCIVSQALLNYFQPHRNILVFWTEQLAMTIVVVLYAFAIVLRADLSEKDKIEMGGWVITTIVVLLICGVATAMAAVVWVNKQIDLDQKNDVSF